MVMHHHQPECYAFFFYIFKVMVRDYKYNQNMTISAIIYLQDCWSLEPNSVLGYIIISLVKILDCCVQIIMVMATLMGQNFIKCLSVLYFMYQSTNTFATKLCVFLYCYSCLIVRRNIVSTVLAPNGFWFGAKIVYLCSFSVSAMIPGIYGSMLPTTQAAPANQNVRNNIPYKKLE